MTDQTFDTNGFAQSMLARMSDLAHYAHDRGQAFAYVRGEGSHGLPITVILATGDLADESAKVAEAWGKRLEDLAAEAAAKREQN